jgi:oxygen-dependent protoporphyrinogen oxidase
VHHGGVTRDVVIIGGGIAGLAAAWRLRHRDVVLLEAGDRLGGRMRSDARGEYWLNYGAHLFPGPGSLVDGMARECGLDTVPVTGSMMGLAVGSKLLITAAWRPTRSACRCRCVTGSRSLVPA